MMKRIVRWLVSSLGYLLYTVVVLSLLLWWLFPAESARTWLQHGLNATVPSVRWEVSDVRVSWPLALVATGIDLQEDRGEEAQLMQLDRVTLWPDFRRVPGGLAKIPLRYEIRALDGSARGNVLLDRSEQRLQGSGALQDINLAQLEGIWTRLNRTVSGTMSGTFSHDLVWPDSIQGTMQAELRVEDGIVSLQQPVFNLPRLEFREMEVSLQLADKVLAVSRGTVESKLLAGEYTGSIALQSPPALSQIKLDGFIEPRPELFGRLQNNTMVTLIKNQLQDNRLSFALTGSFLEPGIVFRGASGVIDGIIKGSGR